MNKISHFLKQKPALLMGIINVTNNSFYQPAHTLDDALKTAEKMIAEGADILDVGGEATSLKIKIAPNVQAELARVIPMITALKKRYDIAVSVDTSQPEVMQAAADAGADMINDQRALKLPGALTVAVNLQLPVCLMHGFYPSRIAGSSTKEELLAKIKSDCLSLIDEYQSAGLAKDLIILDPGFGQGHYGKNAEENYYLLKHLHELVALGYPVLSGWSRKSMLGDILGGAPPEDRLYASIAAAVLSVQQGASIIRTHDVGATSDALKVLRTVDSLG